MTCGTKAPGRLESGFCMRLGKTYAGVHFLKGRSKYKSFEVAFGEKMILKGSLNI